MLKIALAAGIIYEWVLGSPVSGLESLAFAALRMLSGTLLAWMVLEFARTLWLVAMSMDPRPGADRRSGAPR